MPQSAYPSGSDLKTFLELAGLEITTALDRLLQTAADAGVQAFEAGAARKMLAGESETRVFDPPYGATALLIDDLASYNRATDGTKSAATIAVEYEPQGSSAETFTLNEDYRLEPRNAYAREVPYTRLHFARRWWQPHSMATHGAIQVTGRFGYAPEIPDDAWMAMLQLAGLWVFSARRFATTGGLLSWKEGDVSEDYGVMPASDLIKQWETGRAVAMSYRRAEL